MELKVTRIYSQLEMEELSVLNSRCGWVKVEEGRTRSDLMPVFPRVSLLSVGLWGFSITGFLIKKFPVREIKLNRQYKRNKKSIRQLTFLLYVIERFCFSLIRFAYTCDCSEFPTGVGVRMKSCRESSCPNHIFMVNGVSYNMGPSGAQG